MSTCGIIDPAVAIAGMCVEGAVVMWLLPSRHLDSPKEEAKKAVLFFGATSGSQPALLFFGYAESSRSDDKLVLFHRSQ